MILSLLPFILIIVSAIANAVMDKISFHHGESIFKDWSSWWNPKKSHKFKWKDGVKTNGERFPLSSTLLVGITDAWHAFKSVMRWSYVIAIPIYYWSGPFYSYTYETDWFGELDLGVLIDFAILGFLQLITFHVFFTYIFSSKPNNQNNK